jgi:hypothetical protein
MATPYQNRLYGHVWFRTVGANVVISLADCSTDTSLENVQNMVVTKIISSGVWKIYRGSNVVFTTSNTNCTFDFMGNGTALGVEFANATITANTSDANASIMIQVAKQSTANGTII